MVPEEVEIAIDIDSNTVARARMRSTILAPEGVVSLTVMTSVRVHTGEDKQVQRLYNLEHFVCGVSLAAIYEACAELVCFEQVGGERDEGIRWSPLSGMNAAQDQDAVHRRIPPSPYTKDTGLAPLVGNIRA